MGYPLQKSGARRGVGLDAFHGEGNRRFISTLHMKVSTPELSVKPVRSALDWKARNERHFTPIRALGAMERVVFVHGPSAHRALVAVRRLHQPRGLTPMLSGERFQQILLPRRSHTLPSRISNRRARIDLRERLVQILRENREVSPPGRAFSEGEGRRKVRFLDSSETQIVSSGVTGIPHG